MSLNLYYETMFHNNLGERLIVYRFYSCYSTIIIKHKEKIGNPHKNLKPCIAWRGQLSASVSSSLPAPPRSPVAPCSSSSCQGHRSSSPAGYLLLTADGTISPLHISIVSPHFKSADMFSFQKSSLSHQIPSDYSAFHHSNQSYPSLPAFSFSAHLSSSGLL